MIHLELLKPTSFYFPCQWPGFIGRFYYQVLPELRNPSLAPYKGHNSAPFMSADHKASLSLHGKSSSSPCNKVTNQVPCSSFIEKPKGAAPGCCGALCLTEIQPEGGRAPCSAQEHPQQHLRRCQDCWVPPRKALGCLRT